MHAFHGICNMSEAHMIISRIVSFGDEYMQDILPLITRILKTRLLTRLLPAQVATAKPDNLFFTRTQLTALCT